MTQQSHTPPLVCVFLPAKNEAASIAGVIRDIRRSVMTCVGATPRVIVGDDGSTDETAAIAREAGAEVLSYGVSVGLGENFRRAVDYILAGPADALLTIDADGQFDVNDAEALLRPILAGEKDFVTGSRFLEGSTLVGIPKLKRWGNDRMSDIVSGIVGKRFLDVSCGYRVYSRRALRSLNIFGSFTYTQETFLQLAAKGMRIAEVPVHVKYFAERRSRIAKNLFLYGWQTTVIIMKSVLAYYPFRFFGFASIFFFVLGGVLSAFPLVSFIETGAFSPYKFLLVGAIISGSFGVVSLFSGIFLQVAVRLQESLDRILYELRK